jgi:hypothetical protein
MKNQAFIIIGLASLCKNTLIIANWKKMNTNITRNFTIVIGAF